MLFSSVMIFLFFLSQACMIVPSGISPSAVLNWVISLVLMVFVFQSKTGALEGPEVDGFVKDMMELVRVSHAFNLCVQCAHVLRFSWNLVVVCYWSYNEAGVCACSSTSPASVVQSWTSFGQFSCATVTSTTTERSRWTSWPCVWGWGPNSHGLCPWQNHWPTALRSSVCLWKTLTGFACIQGPS